LLVGLQLDSELLVPGGTSSNHHSGKSFVNNKTGYRVELLKGLCCYWGNQQVNLLYLLNILRVLVTKLRTSQCSEAEQLRKSVKAALVLLPLLGITNALVMVRAPLDRSAFEFALWSYSSHFLTSFQGFFVALLYCFLNGEVSNHNT